MDPKQVQQVTDKLAAQTATEKADQKYTEALAGWTVVISAAIWAAFLLWEGFRDKLVKEGLLWLPFAATLMIAVAAMFLSKKGHPPSSG